RTDRGVVNGRGIRTATVMSACIVDRACIAINESAVEVLVAELFARRPRVHRGGGQPEAISPESSRGLGFADADETFAGRGGSRELRGGGRSEPVRRLDAKGEQLPAG